jgi:hypothetical protein
MIRPELEPVIKFLEETPALVRRMTDGLGAEELRRKPVAEEFSFVEHACHLRDIEREGYRERIRKLLSETRPLLADIDGGRLARERRYNEQDFGEGLSAFERARGENVSALRALSAEELGRAGTFEGAGDITLGELVTMMCEHDRAHREEIASLRETLLAGRAAGA